jgi:nucleoside-diphosphate-sugar epimerase
MTAERLFITGGSGYVGRNLIRHFVALGWPVVALARTDAAAATVTALGAQYWRGDLFAADLDAGMAGCSALIHAAADTDHGRGTPGQLAINLDGTQKVLDAARRAGVRRVVHISSESVLLDGRPLVNVTEDQPYPRRPAGLYSASKGAAERLALAASTPDFAVIAIRPRMVWGRDDTTALPQLLAAASSGQLAWIDGGHYRNSSTHIANLCAGVELALAKGRGGEAYFITDGPPWAFRALVTGLLKANGVAVTDKTVPRGLLYAMAKIGDVLANVTGGRVTMPISMQVYATSAVEISLDISKAERELGYRPVISIEQGLAEMAATRSA